MFNVEAGSLYRLKCRFSNHKADEVSVIGLQRQFLTDQYLVELSSGDDICESLMIRLSVGLHDNSQSCERMVYNLVGPSRNLWLMVTPNRYLLHCYHYLAL